MTFLPVAEILDKITNYYDILALKNEKYNDFSIKPNENYKKALLLHEKFIKSPLSAQLRAQLLQHLEIFHLKDANCSALYYEFLCKYDSGAKFHLLLQIAYDTLTLAQIEQNFAVQVKMLYEIARLCLEQKHLGGKPTIDICMLTLRNFAKMDCKDAYDFCCLNARAAEAMVIDGNDAYKKIIQESYYCARSIAKSCTQLTENLFVDAKLFALLVAKHRNYATTESAQKQQNQSIQKIVDLLQPEKILSWIDSLQAEKKKEFSETLHWIDFCKQQNYF